MIKAFLDSSVLVAASASTTGASALALVPHHIVKLPYKLEEKLLKLLDYYELNFGAIDMAKTPEGDYIFFELNPAGQFLWLEQLTGLPLADEMAKFLLGMS